MQPIARRDFLNGAAVTALGLSSAHSAPQDTPAYYPPSLTGLRGSHPGSFEAAHALRDGTFWKTAPAPVPGEDEYDLVVVGAGISGLAAAHFYRAEHPTARILILENHDDVGGHAKRNEFELNGRMELVNGGTLEIDSPRPYSEVADGLLRTLGVHPVELEASCARKGYYESLGLSRGVFLNRETFGADYLAAGAGRRPWAEVLAGAPLTAQDKLDIGRVYESRTDFLQHGDSEEKKARLSRMSYRDYLANYVRITDAALAYCQTLTHDEWGVGADAVSALDCWGFGLPGFQGLELAKGPAPHMGITASGYAGTSSYTFHFPDGNASIVRLLVRSLIPAALPGNTVQDAVTSRLDYEQLDRAGALTTIRLSSIVVGVRNVGSADKPESVEIAYTRFRQVSRVRAKACVLACYNMLIPYLCPDLPEAQKAGLHYLVKTPLIYTNVALTNWRAFAKLGVSEIYAPGSYFYDVELNPVIDIGSYRSVRSPDEPIIVRMTRTPCHPGVDERSQHRLGHAEMLATSFETYEREIRSQLQRLLGDGGFNQATDISAITVNRWPHGYAYEYNPLFDPVWKPGQAPHEIGRAPFGRIVIANSDSGAAAYTDCAIDQAWRAVRELRGI